MDNHPLYQQCRSLVPLGTMRPHHLAAALEAATPVTGCRGDLLFNEGQSDNSIYYLLSGEICLTHSSGRERIITADFHWFPIVQYQPEEFSVVALTDFQVIKFNDFIKEGKAQVTRIDEQSNKKETLADISMGRCFGEDALINHTARNASVTMLSDGVLMRIHRDDFAQLLIDPSQRFVKSQTLDEVPTKNVKFLDVRTQEEFDYRHFADALHIPLRLLRLKVRLLKPDVHYVVYCNSGSRSHAAAYLLAQKGLNVTVLDNGLKSLTQLQVDQYIVDEFEEFHRLAVN